jgi:hypothetical protein
MTVQLARPLLCLPSMGKSNGSSDGSEAVCVEVIDDVGRVLEEVYVTEITGVRSLPPDTLRQVRGTAPPRDR